METSSVVIIVIVLILIAIAIGGAVYYYLYIYSPSTRPGINSLVSVTGNTPGTTNTLIGGNSLVDSTGNRLALDNVSGILSYISSTGTTLFNSTNFNRISGPFVLIMQDNGQLVIKGAGNAVVWTIGTSGTDAPYTLLLNSATTRACIYGKSSATTPLLCMPSDRINSVSNDAYNQGNTLDQGSSLVDSQGNRIFLDYNAVLRYMNAAGATLSQTLGPQVPVAGAVNGTFYTLIMQNNGVLAIYNNITASNKQVVWTDNVTPTVPPPFTFIVMPSNLTSCVYQSSNLNACLWNISLS